MSLYFEREKLKCWPKRNYRLNSLFTARDLLCSSIIPCVVIFAVGQNGQTNSWGLSHSSIFLLGNPLLQHRLFVVVVVVVAAAGGGGGF